MSVSVYLEKNYPGVAIEDLIKFRDLAKQKKDWSTADAIRTGLSECDIILEDGESGTTWRLRNRLERALNFKHL